MLALFGINSFLKWIKIDTCNFSDALGAVLTVSSIMFGFYGTMLCQLISIKVDKERDEKNTITLFFRKVNNKEIYFIMISNVINTISFCMITVLLMICVNANILFILWLCLLGIFVFNQAYTYALFIRIMLYKMPEQKVKRDYSEENAAKIYDSLKEKKNNN